MADDMKFVDGLYVKEPHPNAPDFVKMKISINRKELGNWLRGQTDENINIDVKVSKGLKWYCSVDNFVPDPSRQQAGQSNQQPSNSGQSFESPPAEDFDDDIPF